MSFGVFGNAATTSNNNSGSGFATSSNNNGSGFATTNTTSFGVFGNAATSNNNSGSVFGSSNNNNGSVFGSSNNNSGSGFTTTNNNNGSGSIIWPQTGMFGPETPTGAKKFEEIRKYYELQVCPKCSEQKTLGASFGCGSLQGRYFYVVYCEKGDCSFAANVGDAQPLSNNSKKTSSQTTTTTMQ